MGKSRKRSRLGHCTGYPYNPVRYGQSHDGNNLSRSPDMGGLFAVSPLFAEQMIDAKASQSVAQRQGELKRLEFVRSYTGYAVTKTYSVASSVYNTGRGFTPSLLHPRMAVVEARLQRLAEPVVQALQGTSVRVLQNVDSTVDAALGLAQELVAPRQPQLSSSALEDGPLKARQESLGSIREGLEFLQAHGLLGVAKVATDAVVLRVEEVQKLPARLGDDAEALAERAAAAWQGFVCLPPVSRALEAAEPSVRYGRSKYMAAHDVLIASPAYSRALELAEGIARRVQDNFLYRTAAHRLYPVIAGVADPTLDRITHSTYYAAVLEHLKPQAGQPTAMCA